MKPLKQPSFALWLVPALLVFGIVWRLVPYANPDLLWGWANFAPVAALALFAGARVGNLAWRFVLPVALMLVSDTLIYLSNPQYPFFHDTFFWVYGTFLLTVLLGRLLRKRSSVLRVAALSSGSAVLFFLVTNLGAWYTQALPYPLTLGGLLQSYVAGLPFFWPTLASNLVFAALAFGLSAVLQRREREAVQSPAVGLYV
jgi:hypothetical protein